MAARPEVVVARKKQNQIRPQEVRGIKKTYFDLILT